METTVTEFELELESARERRWREEERRVEELASLSAHVSAATARFVELAWELRAFADGGDVARFVAFRCGLTVREARECLRVAEALEELPATRAAFAQGALTYTKVRALTRVATASSEGVAGAGDAAHRRPAGAGAARVSALDGAGSA